MLALLAGAFAHPRCRVRRGVSVHAAAAKYRERVARRRIEAALGIGDDIEVLPHSRCNVPHAIAIAFAHH
jgi:hypothetical protein